MTRTCGGELALVILGQVLLDDPGDEGGVQCGEDGLVDPRHVTLSGQGDPLTVVLPVGEADVLVVVQRLSELLYVRQDEVRVVLLLCELLTELAVHTIEYVTGSPRGP